MRDQNKYDTFDVLDNPNSPRVTLPYNYGQATVHKSAQLQTIQPAKYKIVAAKSAIAKAALSYLQEHLVWRVSSTGKG